MRSGVRRHRGVFVTPQLKHSSWRGGLLLVCFFELVRFVGGGVTSDGWTIWCMFGDGGGDEGPGYLWMINRN